MNIHGSQRSEDAGYVANGPATRDECRHLQSINACVDDQQGRHVTPQNILRCPAFPEDISENGTPACYQHFLTLCGRLCQSAKHVPYHTPESLPPEFFPED